MTLKPEDVALFGSGNNPITMWIAAQHAPDEIVGAVMHVIGRFGIHRLKDQPRWSDADLAQTVLLRRMGTEMSKVREAIPDMEFGAARDAEVDRRSPMIRQFTKPTAEEYDAAIAYLKASVA